MVIKMSTHSNITFGLVNIPVVMSPVIKDNDTSLINYMRNVYIELNM